MFSEDFVWGVADSACQVEGRTPEDGSGASVWDTFCDNGGVYEGHRIGLACDRVHRYKEDFALMKALGIKSYRFSVSWARILPNGVGEVNPQGIAFYKDMIREMKKNGIEPFFTMFHWEYPQALQDRGGWLNPDSVEWFAEYAKVIAENFSEDCTYFFTMNEPQCFVGLGHLSGVHAPGQKLPLKDTFQIAHNALKAHGAAVINLRKYAKKPILVGYAPTCSVQLPATETPEDIEAAREVYFGLRNPMDNWTWNVSWFSDPVFLGKYPEEGLKRFAEYLPEITEEDMKLISQPLDFMGQNVYNGNYVRRGEDGSVEYLPHYYGFPKTATQWPVTPECLYWSCRFLYERYHMPIYITENGMACHDYVSLDGRVHDADRINFLERYIAQIQRAVDEGIAIKGYFLWTFMDNFEWSSGYSDRFGIVYVDFRTQKRIVKDSAYWYRDVVLSNGRSLAVNNPTKELMYLEPILKECCWGGNRLVTDFPYHTEADRVGECWAVSADAQRDSRILNGRYEGMTLSQVYREHRGEFGNLSYEEFPILVKLIDAANNLSIQVHPDDAYAQKVEKVPFGKTEHWYVLDCDEDAAIVLGHHAKSKEELVQMVSEKRYEELIRKVPVKKGDVIQIEPGTLHATIGNILIMEIQQNSDITYRVYDYERLVNGVPRQLHVEKSLDVIQVPDHSDKAAITRSLAVQPNQMTLFAENSYYKAWKLDVDKKAVIEPEWPFLILSVVEGNGIVDGHFVKKGDNVLVPNGYGRITILGDLEIIATTAVDK